MICLNLRTLAFAAAATAATLSASVTPHAQYSSSIGVLGCKIDTNRVAYWPSMPDCGDKMCVKLSYGGRSLNVIHIDQSGGAYDISYDAWNTLVYGKNATADPQEGGGMTMTYEYVGMDQCADLITTSDGSLPLMAANSMNYVASCLSQPTSWVAEHHSLWNIANSVCTLGLNEKCTLNMAVSNQPSCPHQLGLQTPLTGQPVYNIAYGTGKEVLATS